MAIDYMNGLALVTKILDFSFSFFAVMTHRNRGIIPSSFLHISYILSFENKYLDYSYDLPYRMNINKIKSIVTKTKSIRTK